MEMRSPNYNSGFNAPPPAVNGSASNTNEIDVASELFDLSGGVSEKVCSVTDSAFSHRSSPQLGNDEGSHVPLEVHPGEQLNKSYIASLRKFQMGHCDRSQVLYRIRNMTPDALVDFTRDLVEMVETFGEQWDHLRYGKPSPMPTDHRSVTVPLSYNSEDRDGSQAASADHVPRARVLLPHELPGFHARGLYDPKTASFASVMTTNSIASNDPRPPISETSHLRKTEDVEGNKVINKYTVVGELGKGAFGKVKLGVNNELNESVAIKIIRKSILKKSADPSALNREIAILKKVNHRNTVSLYEVIDDPASDKLYLIMQYVPNGPIVKVKSDCTCQPLDERVAKFCFKQLISGVRYLHKRGIVHRDIKPDNILVGPNNHVLITDFGVSDFVQKSSRSMSMSRSRLSESRRGTTATAGTPLFLSPENLKVKGGANKQRPGDDEDEEGEGDAGGVRSVEEMMAVDAENDCDPIQERFLAMAADVWAVGVTMWMCLVGAPPFSIGKGYSETVRSICHDDFDWPETNTDGDPLDPRWGELLNGMLQREPDARWSLKRVKNHILFSDVQSLEMSSRLTEVTKEDVSNATTTCCMFLPDEASPVLPPKNNFVAKVRTNVVQPRGMTDPILNHSGPALLPDVVPLPRMPPHPLEEVEEERTSPQGPDSSQSFDTMAPLPLPSGTVPNPRRHSGGPQPRARSSSSSSSSNAVDESQTAVKVLCPSPPRSGKPLQERTSSSNAPSPLDVTQR